MVTSTPPVNHHGHQTDLKDTSLDTYHRRGISNNLSGIIGHKNKLSGIMDSTKQVKWYNCPNNLSGRQVRQRENPCY